jgi:hypothetical protein
MRWILLLALNYGRPNPVTEALIAGTARELIADASPLEIRRELDYLEGRKLVVVRREPSGQWLAEITRHGIDIVEYTTDCEPGIARPAKYW